MCFALLLFFAPLARAFFGCSDFPPRFAGLLFALATAFFVFSRAFFDLCGFSPWLTNFSAPAAIAPIALPTALATFVITLAFLFAPSLRLIDRAIELSLW